MKIQYMSDLHLEFCDNSRWMKHNELPVTGDILVLAGDNANIGDYGFMSCSRVRAQEGEFLDCKQKIDACKCYTDRDDFEDDVADFLAGALISLSERLVTIRYIYFLINSVI